MAGWIYVKETEKIKAGTTYYWDNSEGLGVVVNVDEETNLLKVYFYDGNFFEESKERMEVTVQKDQIRAALGYYGYSDEAKKVVYFGADGEAPSNFLMIDTESESRVSHLDVDQNLLPNYRITNDLSSDERVKERIIYSFETEDEEGEQDGRGND